MQSAIIVHFEFYQHLIFSKQTKQKLNMKNYFTYPRESGKKPFTFPTKFLLVNTTVSKTLNAEWPIFFFGK